MVNRICRDGVVCIVAGKHVEKDRGVGDSPGDWPECVTGWIGRHHTVAADKWYRGAESNEAVYGRRTTNGPTGIFANTDHPEIRSNARTRSARGSTWVASRVVGIPNHAKS